MIVYKFSRRGSHVVLHIAEETIEGRTRLRLLKTSQKPVRVKPSPLRVEKKV